MKKRLKKWTAGVLVGVLALSAAVPALASSSASKEALVKFQSKTNALEFDPTGMPADFQFGTREIEKTDRYYPETNAAGISIKINDERAAVNSGWRLFVQLGDFTDGTFTLGGATITMRSGSGLGQFIHTNTWGSDPATMAAAVTLTAGGGQEVLLHANPTSPKGAGVGDTELKFPPVSGAATTANPGPTGTIPIELKVPGATAFAVQYRAPMIWTLNNAP